MTTAKATGGLSLSAANSSSHRVDYIDILRGAACLWVVIHHSFERIPLYPGAAYYPLWLFREIARAGWLGVSLFLVLSGFCLYFPLIRRNPMDEIRLDIKSFAKKRAWRILPPYYAAFFGFALVHFVFNHKPFYESFYQVLGGPTGTLLHIFMLFNLNSHAFGLVTGVFWSIALECQLYLLFPLFVWSYGRYGCRPTLLVVFLVSLAWQIYCYHKLGFTILWPVTYVIYYDALPGRCFEFALGMAAAAFCARPHPKQSRIAIALLLALPLPALYFVLKVSRFGPLVDPLWGIIFAATLVLLSRVSNRIFDSSVVGRLFVWIGTISYSIYLVHGPLIGFLTPAVMHIRGTLAAGLVRLPILIGAGYIFHLAAERPFMRSLKKPKQFVTEAAAPNVAPLTPP